jgi:exodeoxyribonuclease V alpha subunit
MQQQSPQQRGRVPQTQQSRWGQQQAAVAPGKDVPMELVELRGVVKRITFASADSGFTVLKVEREEHNDLVTVVGSFPPTNVGAAVSVRGEWQRDARWGKQLRAVEYNETAPATQEGIENYLASGLVRGIGPVAAKQIVSFFGAETLTVLNEAPERLVEVEGIGPKKAKMIEQAWRGQKEVTAVMLFLQSHNVSTALATRIYKKYGNQSVEVLRRDPYQLADEMEGIGFRTVDKIAAQLGFDPASPTRYRSGLLFLLREQANEGHCFGSRAGLLREGCKLLGAEPAFLEAVLYRMVAAGDFIAHGEKDGAAQEQALFLPFFDMCETQTAYRIQDLMAQPPNALRAAMAADETRFARAVERAQQEGGVVFDDGQLQGLKAAARGRFTVVTGGPGTGKTTMAMAIIRLFQGEGAKVVLCAPTGRAAQRLAEGSGLEAKTIHRLLEYSSETKGFGRGPGNLLECDALVVDEASMVDVVLMHHLLAALPSQASVVLVGDVDQLPPVGPGNVLRDIIDSGTVDVVRLRTIFRQAERSAIVTNAHRINRGELPELDGKKETGAGGGGSDFFLLEEEDPSKVVEVITDLCTKRLPQRYGVDPVADIQVLCPMKKGEVGTLHLNTVLQRALNPVKDGAAGGKGAVKYGGREFRVGDKVMQVKNNYEKNVFNGGVGTIVSADAAAKTLGVRFDGVPDPVAYDATELDQIMLAYAATVHKAQGSEYRVVVAPLLLRQHQPMLQRNLLYTCVTRARELLVLVGSRQAIARAVANDKPATRNSLLHRRLITPKGQPLFGGGDAGARKEEK